MQHTTHLDVVKSFMNSETMADLINTVHSDVIVEEWMSEGRKVVGLDRLLSEILEPAQDAFSESEYEIISFVSSDDLVAVHARFQGIFSGSYLGFEPTMKTIGWSFHDKFRVVDGKIVEMWFCSDTHAIMKQIAAPETS
jgi:predicted ester cyclase